MNQQMLFWWKSLPNGKWAVARLSFEQVRGLREGEAQVGAEPEHRLVLYVCMCVCFGAFDMGFRLVGTESTGKIDGCTCLRRNLVTG